MKEAPAPELGEKFFDWYGAFSVGVTAQMEATH